MIINHETEAKHNTKQTRNAAKFLWLFASILAVLSVLPLAAEATEASLFLSPGSGQYQVGSTFQVKVKTDSKGTPINAAEAKFHFLKICWKWEVFPKKGQYLNFGRRNRFFQILKEKLVLKEECREDLPVKVLSFLLVLKQRKSGKQKFFYLRLKF